MDATKLRSNSKAIKHTRLTNKEFSEFVPHMELDELFGVQIMKDTIWIHMFLINHKNKKFTTVTCNVCNTAINLDAFKSHLANVDHKNALKKVNRFYHAIYTYPKCSENLAKGEKASEEELRDAVTKADAALDNTFQSKMVLYKRLAKAIENAEKSNQPKGFEEKLISLVLNTNAIRPQQMYAEVCLPLLELLKVEFKAKNNQWKFMLKSVGVPHPNGKYFCELCSKYCAGIITVNAHLGGFSHKNLQLQTLAMRHQTHPKLTKNCAFRFDNKYSLTIKDPGRDVFSKKVSALLSGKQSEKPGVEKKVVKADTKKNTVQKSEVKSAKNTENKEDEGPDGNNSKNENVDEKTIETAAVVNVDKNIDEKMDKNSDENMDENTDENMDKNTDENMDENTDENMDEINAEEVNKNTDGLEKENADEKSDELNKNADEVVNESEDKTNNEASDEKSDETANAVINADDTENDEISVVENNANEEIYTISDEEMPETTHEVSDKTAAQESVEKIAEATASESKKVETSVNSKPANVPISSKTDKQKDSEKNKETRDSYETTKLSASIAAKAKALSGHVKEKLAPKVENPIEIDGGGLIGVEYVVKLTKSANDPAPMYECCLCDVARDESRMEAHLINHSHRNKYCELHYPDTVQKYKMLMGHMKYFDYVSTMSCILAKVALAIEKHHGRAAPHVIPIGLFKKIRGNVVSKIYAMYHACQQHGPSFTNVVSSAEIQLLKKAKGTYKPIIVPSNDPGRFTKAPGEKPYLGRAPVPEDHLWKEEERKLTATQHNRSKSPNIRKPKELNKPSRSVQHRSRSRSRSPNRNAQTSHKTRQPVHHVSHSSSNTDIWRKYREEILMAASDIECSYMKYRENPESHPLYDSEWNQYWKRRKEELIRQGVDHRSFNFQPEWVVFFKQRVEQLFSEDLLQSKAAVRQRLNIPLDAEEDSMSGRTLARTDEHYSRPAMASPLPAKLSLKRRDNLSKYPEIIEPPQKQRRTDTNKSEPTQLSMPSTYGSASQMKPVADDKSGVIHVLRLLTALEDHLGSLGTKIMDLLSKALVLDKQTSGQPMELEKKILTVSNCNLLETAMEKLKGILYAGLLDGNKVQGFNRVIQSTTDILMKAEQMGLRNNMDFAEKSHFSEKSTADLEKLVEIMQSKRATASTSGQKSLSDTLIDLISMERKQNRAQILEKNSSNNTEGPSFPFRRANVGSSTGNPLFWEYPEASSQLCGMNSNNSGNYTSYDNGNGSGRNLKNTYTSGSGGNSFNDYNFNNNNNNNNNRNANNNHSGSVSNMFASGTMPTGNNLNEFNLNRTMFTSTDGGVGYGGTNNEDFQFNNNANKNIASHRPVGNMNRLMAGAGGGGGGGGNNNNRGSNIADLGVGQSNYSQISNRLQETNMYRNLFQGSGGRGDSTGGGNSGIYQNNTQRTLFKRNQNQKY